LSVKVEVILSTPFSSGVDSSGVDRRTLLTLNDVGGIYLTVLCSSLASDLQGCEAVSANNNNNNNNNNNEYLMRHDKVCTHLHYSICKALGIETADKWYTHMPKQVYEEGDVTVLWNQAVHTDREVTANRLDTIIKNKKEKTCTLIDVAIPTDRNVVQKEAEKKLKYKSLCI
jgi:hypothetical protein